MHHTCEVVFSKTYVKRKHDTFYKKLPSQPQKTSKAAQCLFWRGVLELVLVSISDHALLLPESSMPLPIRVEERETPESSFERNYDAMR